MKTILKTIIIVLFITSCTEDKICEECYDVIGFSTVSFVGLDLKEVRYEAIYQCDNSRVFYNLVIPRDEQPELGLVCY